MTIRIIILYFHIVIYPKYDIGNFMMPKQRVCVTFDVFHL